MTGNKETKNEAIELNEDALDGVVGGKTLCRAKICEHVTASKDGKAKSDLDFISESGKGFDGMNPKKG